MVSTRRGTGVLSRVLLTFPDSSGYSYWRSLQF